MAFDWSKFQEVTPQAPSTPTPEPTANQAGAAAFDWSKFQQVSPSPTPAPQPSTMSLPERAQATPGAQFLPDTNVGKGELAATQFLSGATGQEPAQAASSGLRQALQDRSISYDQYKQMSGLAQQSATSPSGYLQQLESVKAENPTLSGASNLAGQAVGAAASQPAADIIIPATFSAGAGALNDVKDYFTKSAIPGLKKLATKVGGNAGIAKLVKVLDKYGVNDLPAFTKRGLHDKIDAVADGVGKVLGDNWKQIDATADTAISGNKAADVIFENWKAEYKLKAGIDAPKSAQESALSAINDYIRPNELYTHTDLQNMATDIQKNAWSKQALNTAKTDVQVGFAIRRANLEMAAAGNVPEELLAGAAKASDEYNKLAGARAALKGSLDKSGNAYSVAGEWTRHMALGMLGQYGVAADAAFSAGRSTAGKTAIAAASKIGAKILGTVADMGPYQKVMLNIASRGGLKALHDYHVNQYMSSDKYAELFDQAEAKQP